MTSLKITPLTLGETAFEAYRQVVGGSTYDGKPIPPWKELTDKIREGWELAANAVIVAHRTEYQNSAIGYTFPDAEPGPIHD